MPDSEQLLKCFFRTWFADDLAVDDPQRGLRAHVLLVAVGGRVVEPGVQFHFDGKFAKMLAHFTNKNVLISMKNV